MKVGLDVTEKNLLLTALNVARYFYEKTNRIDRAVEAQQVHDFLAGAEGIAAHITFDGWTQSSIEEYKELLHKREAKLKGDGKVIELYQFASFDGDDPDQVSADQEIARIAREWIKDHNKNRD